MSYLNANKLLCKIISKNQYSLEFYKSRHAQEIIIKSKKKCIEFSSIGDQYGVGGDIPFFRLDQQEVRSLLTGVLGSEILNDFLG